MRTLILSCNTGAGHNSCSQAIQECFAAHGGHCDLADALGFISQRASDVISAVHVRLYRYFPKLFRGGYRYLEKHGKLLQKESMAYRFFASGAGRLAEFIRAGGYDAVICTHVFSAMMLTEARRFGGLSAKTAFVATDYTCSPGVEQSDLDLYFIPDPCLAGEFVSCGIAPDRIIASGIPVRSMFYRPRNRREAAAAIGIPDGQPNVLVMCGSMGCGPIPKLTALMAERLAPDQHITVACSTNRKLKQRLQKRYAGVPNIHVQGFVEDIRLLMDSADIYLTKPGGLSTGEAAAMSIPMVLVDAVSGCEEYNRRYFVNQGIAVTADTPKELADLCAALLSDADKTEKMRAAAEARFQTSAAEEIYRCMLDARI